MTVTPVSNNYFDILIKLMRRKHLHYATKTDQNVEDIIANTLNGMVSLICQRQI